MRLLKLGDRITLNERSFEVVGLTPMSVRPRRVFLLDLQTNQQLGVEASALCELERSSRLEQL